KGTLRQKILRYVESRIRELSCIVVSDYAKGVVSAALMSEIVRLAALRKVPVIVDPK
ncbi:MAG TPA: bifunctional heptose 7-phosphate kinase/heptose 1-phosphate adenyltransferase, partial [Solibacterales bacterium]|nr:bifunctional heptose 7-phosphate kinase/heptose 1-phosphate adenyltransferase [Bryobacterales bacterium]